MAAIPLAKPSVVADPEPRLISICLTAKPGARSVAFQESRLDSRSESRSVTKRRRRRHCQPKVSGHKQHNESESEECQSERPLTCPFRKRNPARFDVRSHPTCALRPFSSLPLLKRHILKMHIRAPTCSRCQSEFDNESMLKKHLAVCLGKMGGLQKAIYDPENGINSYMRKVLVERKRPGKVREWAQLCKLLFPADTTIPSPDFVEVVENFQVKKEIEAKMPDLIHSILTDLSSNQIKVAEAAESICHKVVNSLVLSSRISSPQLGLDESLAQFTASALFNDDRTEADQAEDDQANDYHVEDDQLSCSHLSDCQSGCLMPTDGLFGKNLDNWNWQSVDLDHSLSWSGMAEAQAQISPDDDWLANLPPIRFLSGHCPDGHCQDGTTKCLKFDQMADPLASWVWIDHPNNQLTSASGAWLPLLADGAHGESTASSNELAF